MSDSDMGKPTFQLILDFAKYCVRPFYYSFEQRDVSLLVSELKFGVDEELSGAQLKHFIFEYHRRFAPTREFTAAMADEFADLVFEMNRAFGGTLTEEALDILKRDGLAPKKPRLWELK